MLKKLLLFVIAIFILENNQISGIKFSTQKHCCNLGTNYASSGLKCIGFQPPVVGIEIHEEPDCLHVVQQCCENQYKTAQCELGKEMSHSGKLCTSDTNNLSDTKKECCDACSWGEEAASTGSQCEITELGSPSNEMFRTCCEEALSATSSTTPTTAISVNPTMSSRTTPATTPKSNRATTDRNYEQEKIDLCLIEDVCAQLCIPMEDSYRCDCEKGFALMADGVSCKPMKTPSGGDQTAAKPQAKTDRCAKNNPCEHVCVDTGVSIQCSCRQGYELAKDKISCRDIDECARNIHNCEEGTECMNDDGTYYCENGSDFFTDDDDDTPVAKCPDGYRFDSETKSCDDIDECELSIICPRPKSCKNTAGSFICEGNDVQNCPPGYYFKEATQKCEDIDECITGENDCNNESQNCLNTKGNFTCIDKASRNSCPPGFKNNPSTSRCEDINECLENENLCAAGEECVNEIGGHTCAPQSYPKPPPLPSLPPRPGPPIVPQNMPEATSARPRPPPFQQTIPQPSSTTRPATTSSTTTTAYSVTRPRPYPVTILQQTATEEVPIRQYVPTVPRNHCTSGFKFSVEQNRCIDVDECRSNRNICDLHQTCYNTMGSYICNCKPGFTKDYQTGACTDINECQIGSHDCSDGQRCDNSIGSYVCARVAGCGTGYTLSYASGVCEDDDECRLGTHHCGAMGDEYHCRNTHGSYRCERIRKTIVVPVVYVGRRPEYVSTIPATPVTRGGVTPVHVPASTTDQYLTMLAGQHKRCLPGYVMSARGICQDINECESNPCKRAEKCRNLNGRFECVPSLQCPRGYEINEDGDNCIDINECTRDTHTCTANQICRNGPGFYLCTCPPGYKINPTGCTDVDECEYSRGAVCPANADCTNTIGSYKCGCKDGFREQNKVCDDINECNERGGGKGVCEQACINMWGSYRCSCKMGFSLNADNRTCTDIDECEKFKDKHLCIGTCVNVPGSYTCKCPDGYNIGSDGRTCQDIDECLRNPCANVDDICINTRGGYKCQSIQCPPNYIRDVDRKSRCKRAPTFCDARDYNCMEQPEQFTFHFISFVSELPLLGGSGGGAATDFFQIKGPNWQRSNCQFNFTMQSVRCPAHVPRADTTFFRLSPSAQRAVLSVVRPLHGPQDIELSLEMKMYHEGVLRGTAVARIFVFVSEYKF